MGTVTARQTTITIPGFEITPRNRHPYFGGADLRDAYPYELGAAHFRLAAPRPRRYRLLVLENPYLRISVLPQLGGRMHALEDKTNGGRNVLYSGDLRFVPDGIGMNYVGHGMEVNLPDAHAITTTRPRNWMMREYPHGAHGITIWETEWVGRCQYSFTFLLHPDRACVEQHVQIFNPTFLPRRIRYWANPAIPSDASTEFVFPEQYADMHGGTRRFHWPVFLGMDLSWFRNNEDVLGLYYLMVREGYFGYYNHDGGYGLVHAGDPFETPGKKLWTWGMSAVGDSRRDVYGGPYSEIQSGRLENQDHFEWLPPGGSLRWVEHWYPIKQMNAFHWATADAAVRADIQGSELAIQLHTTRKRAHLEVRAEAESRLLSRAVARVTPQQTWRGTLALPRTAPRDHRLRVRLVDMTAGGRCLGCFSPVRRPTPAEEVVAMGDSFRAPSERTSETLTLKAAWDTRMGRYAKAEAGLHAALGKDPHYSPAHRQLAVFSLRRADVESAKRHLHAALSRNEFDGTARALLGEIALLEDDRDAAEEQFMSATRCGEEMAGFAGAARVLMRRGEYLSATHRLERALEHNARNVRLHAVLAVARRLMGDSNAAEGALDAALVLEPTDAILHFERAQLHAHGDSRRRAALLRRLRARITGVMPEQYWLEIALFYNDLGRLTEAIEAAKIGAAIKGASGDTHPMFPYLLAILRGAHGARAVQKEFDRADTCSLDFAWPFRIEEGLLLRRLVRERPRDGRLAFLLGIFLYRMGAPGEADECWRRAEALGVTYPGLHRNRGWLLADGCHTVRRSLAQYRKALKGWPDDPYVLTEICRLMMTCTNSSATISKSASASPRGRKRSPRCFRNAIWHWIVPRPCWLFRSVCTWRGGTTSRRIFGRTPA